MHVMTDPSSDKLTEGVMSVASGVYPPMPPLIPLVSTSSDGTMTSTNMFVVRVPYELLNSVSSRAVRKAPRKKQPLCKVTGIPRQPAAAAAGALSQSSMSRPTTSNVVSRQPPPLGATLHQQISPPFPPMNALRAAIQSRPPTHSPCSAYLNLRPDARFGVPCTSSIAVTQANTARSVSFQRTPPQQNNHAHLQQQVPDLSISDRIHRDVQSQLYVILVHHRQLTDHVMQQLQYFINTVACELSNANSSSLQDVIKSMTEEENSIRWQYRMNYLRTHNILVAQSISGYTGAVRINPNFLRENLRVVLSCSHRFEVGLHTLAWRSCLLSLKTCIDEFWRFVGVFKEALAAYSIYNGCCLQLSPNTGHTTGCHGSQSAAARTLSESGQSQLPAVDDTERQPVIVSTATSQPHPVASTVPASSVIDGLSDSRTLISGVSCSSDGRLTDRRLTDLPGIVNTEPTVSSAVDVMSMGSFGLSLSSDVIGAQSPTTGHTTGCHGSQSAVGRTLSAVGDTERQPVIVSMSSSQPYPVASSVIDGLSDSRTLISGVSCSSDGRLADRCQMNLPGIVKTESSDSSAVDVMSVDSFGLSLPSPSDVIGAPDLKSEGANESLPAFVWHKPDGNLCIERVFTIPPEDLEAFRWNSECSTAASSELPSLTSGETQVGEKVTATDGEQLSSVNHEVDYVPTSVCSIPRSTSKIIGASAQSKFLQRPSPLLKLKIVRKRKIASTTNRQKSTSIYSSIWAFKKKLIIEPPTVEPVIKRRRGRPPKRPDTLLMTSPAELKHRRVKTRNIASAVNHQTSTSDMPVVQSSPRACQKEPSIVPTPATVKRRGRPPKHRLDMLPMTSPVELKHRPEARQKVMAMYCSAQFTPLDGSKRTARPSLSSAMKSAKTASKFSNGDFGFTKSLVTADNGENAPETLSDTKLNVQTTKPNPSLPADARPLIAEYDYSTNQLTIVATESCTTDASCNMPLYNGDLNKESGLTDVNGNILSTVSNLYAASQQVDGSSSPVSHGGTDTAPNCSNGVGGFTKSRVTVSNGENGPQLSNSKLNAQSKTLNPSLYGSSSPVSHSGTDTVRNCGNGVAGFTKSRVTVSNGENGPQLSNSQLNAQSKTLNPSLPTEAEHFLTEADYSINQPTLKSLAATELSARDCDIRLSNGDLDKKSDPIAVKISPVDSNIMSTSQQVNGSGSTASHTGIPLFSVSTTSKASHGGLCMMDNDSDEEPDPDRLVIDLDHVDPCANDHCVTKSSSRSMPVYSDISEDEDVGDCITSTAGAAVAASIVSQQVAEAMNSTSVSHIVDVSKSFTDMSQSTILSSHQTRPSKIIDLNHNLEYIELFNETWKGDNDGGKSPLKGLWTERRRVPVVNLCNKLCDATLLKNTGNPQGRVKEEHPTWLQKLKPRAVVLGGRLTATRRKTEMPPSKISRWQLPRRSRIPEKDSVDIHRPNPNRAAERRSTLNHLRAHRQHAAVAKLDRKFVKRSQLLSRSDARNLVQQQRRRPTRLPQPTWRSCANPRRFRRPRFHHGDRHTASR